jgi:hypothetical protein
MTALSFVLGNVWHFAGAVVLLILMFDGVAHVIRAVRESDPWHD